MTEPICRNCGASGNAQAAFCATCGARRVLPPGPGGWGQPAVYPTVGPAFPAGKDRLVAVVLAIFLGGFGLHKFYLNRIGQGIVYLIFCWTGIPSLVGWTEGLLYLARSDADWAAEYGGPVRQSNPTAVGCLWLVVLLPFLILGALVLTLLLGGQILWVLASSRVS